MKSILFYIEIKDKLIITKKKKEKRKNDKYYKLIFL